MELVEDFLTIETFTETKFKEKGSLFIGQSYPLTKEDEAHEILEQVRKKFFDATHHCYSYSLINGSIRYSDAGEPSGTAGIRILNAIQHFDLQNLLVVVIRYFGGTKLGVGPLGKAYYNSSYLTLEQASKVRKTVYRKIYIEFDYSMISQIHHILARVHAKILNTNFEKIPTIECIIKSGEIKRTISEVIEVTKGNYRITESGETLFV